MEEIREVTPIGSMISAAVEHFRAALPTPRPLGPAALAAITVPAYVAIAGRRSQAGGTAAAARARLIPGAEVQIWPDTTHSLPKQVPGPIASPRSGRPRTPRWSPEARRRSLWWSSLAGFL